MVLSVQRAVIYCDVSHFLYSCLRNVVSMFHILEKELAWRKAQGRPEGFETLRARKTLVAVGAEAPLAKQSIMADYFRES